MLRYWASLLPAALAGFLGTSSGYSDTISTWNGRCTAPGVCGTWSIAKDWIPPVVPNNSAGTKYEVTIGSSGFVELDTSLTINSLALDGLLYAPPSGPAPKLTVVHGANINGNLLFGGDFTMPTVGPGSLSVGGDLRTGSSSLFFVVGNGSVTVGGNLTHETGSAQFYSGSGADVLRVGGTLTNDQNGVVLLGGGRCFSLLGCSPSPGYAPSPVGGPVTSIGSLVNRGQIYSWSNITSSALINYGTTSFIGNSANVRTLKNGGTIYLANSCCSIALEPTSGLNIGPGAAGGLGYNQSSGGILDELLLGKSTYGSIAAGSWLLPGGREVGYPVSLNGTLDIMQQNGFTPSTGETFTILTFAPGELSGTFSKITGDPYFSVSYNDAAGDVVLTAEPVPEPDTLLLLVPALAFGVWLSRRKTL